MIAQWPVELLANDWSSVDDWADHSGFRVRLLERTLVTPSRSIGIMLSERGHSCYLSLPLHPERLPTRS